MTSPRTGSDDAEALTPSWLTSALLRSGALPAGAAVTAVEREPVGEGVGFLSRLYRLHLTTEGDGPTTVVAKLPTDTEYLALAEGFSAYRREITFYTSVAPSCPLRTPEIYAAEVTTDTEFVLLMEDLSYLENGDHVEGISYARAESVIDELVKLHAWGWALGPDASRDEIFVPLNGPIIRHGYSMGIAAGWAAYLPEARTAIPKGISEVIENWPEHLPRMLDRLASPATLINGDLRVDNLFFDEDDNATIVDFQMTMQGSGVWDVAYLVGQGMTPGERSGRERALVQRYVDGLAAAGIDYPFAQAWEQFRIALVAQLTMPLTAGMSWNGLNDRAKELLHALNERAFAIIQDTDALSSLRF